MQEKRSLRERQRVKPGPEVDVNSYRSDNNPFVAAAAAAAAAIAGVLFSPASLLSSPHVAAAAVADLKIDWHYLSLWRLSDMPEGSCRKD